MAPELADTIETTPRRRAAGAALALAPAGLVLVSWIAWMWLQGGYFPRDWYPVGIGMVALLGIAAAARWQLPASRLARASLALLAAFTALNVLSIAWADAPGNALEAADKLLLYLAAAALLALTPWTARRATWFLAVWSVATLVACVVTLLDAASAADATSWFIEGRYAEPLRYAGGSAAVAAIAVWPALLLSMSRELPAPLRAALLAVAVVLAQLAILPQSRGAVLALMITVPVALVLAPRRFALLARLAASGVAIALTLGPVLDVYSSARDGRPIAPALDDAVTALLVAAAIAFALGLVVALAERRLELPESRTRQLRVGSLIAAGVAGLVVIVLLLANAGRISDSVSDRWDDFRSGQDDSAQSESRLTSTGDPQRYDYWRVALDVGRDAPLLGAGAGNYEPHYTQLRREEKHSRYAHDVWLRFFAETGVIGLALLLAALACAFVAILRGCRRAPPEARLVAVACAVATVYFLLHASLDWVDEFPAVAAPGIALLFLGLKTLYPGQATLAVAAGTDQPGEDRPRAEDPPRTEAPAAGPLPRLRAGGPAADVAQIAILVVALAALALPYLSLRYSERGAGRWNADREAAIEDLDRAHDLNPWSIRPRLTEGALAVRDGDYALARASYTSALETEDNWYAHFELALLDSAAGRRTAAQRQIDRASALNGTDPLVADVRAAIHRGRRLDPRRVHTRIERETRERFYSLR